MGVIERLVASWEDASFAVVAALALLSGSLASRPGVSLEFVSEGGVEVGAAIPSQAPAIVSIEDDDREVQEDDLELCGLPGVRIVWPPSLPLAQITPPLSLSRAALASTRHPLRC
jgi:hypothetical protein